MPLVRMIYVVKINVSEWLAATAHPSCLWQGAHTAGCLGSTLPDSQGTACCLQPSSSRGAHKEHSPASPHSLPICVHPKSLCTRNCSPGWTCIQSTISLLNLGRACSQDQREHKESIPLHIPGCVVCLVLDWESCA